MTLHSVLGKTHRMGPRIELVIGAFRRTLIALSVGSPESFLLRADGFCLPRDREFLKNGRLRTSNNLLIIRTRPELHIHPEIEGVAPIVE